VKAKQFTDVTFPRQYPRHDVADHEVIMAFRNDDDAEKFRQWWDEVAATEFYRWLQKQGDADA